jgi:hypothetical protein
VVKGPDICTNYVYAASRVAVLWYIAVIYPAGAGMHYYSQLYVQFGVMFTVMGEACEIIHPRCEPTPVKCKMVTPVIHTSVTSQVLMYMKGNRI